MGCINRFERIGVVARIEHFGGYRHRRRREVLHLFKFIAHLARETCQLSHISLTAAWMAGDEVGDNLLIEMLLAIDTVEDTLELVELLERWLAHQLQHMVTGMLGSHLQTSANMVFNEFAGIFHRSLVRFLVFAVMQQQIVAHTTADETLLDTRQGVYSPIYLQQL